MADPNSDYFKKLAEQSANTFLNKTQQYNNLNESISPYTYDAGKNSGSFYKRYKALGKETFDEIGFSPFNKNEEVFNEGVSWYTDFKRSLVYGAAPLFVRGFVSGPKSLGQMLQGNFGEDEEEAEAYAEASAIGSSTRGGIAGFTGNLLTNFGYTAGIMIEAVAEEVLTAGLSSEYTIFNAGKNLTKGFQYVGRAPKVARGVRATESILSKTKPISSSLRNLDNITEARNYFQSLKVDKSLENIARQSAKAGKTKGGKLLNYFNPINNTTDAIADVIKTSKNFQGLDKVGNALYKTAGGIYRDIRNVNMALSEARLEAGFTKKDTFDQLFDEYRETHNGEAPPDEIQDEMRKSAQQAANSALIANSFLIFYSNKIAFDNIMSPKKGLNRIINKKISDLKESVASRTFREFTTKTLKSGTKVLTPKLTTIKKGWNGFRGTVQAIKKLGPRQVAKNVIGYTKANVMEGFQESMQDVIAKTSKDYYTEAFYSEPVASHYYTESYINERDHENRSIWNNFSEGLQAQLFETNARGEFVDEFGMPILRGEKKEKQYSTRGLETFASGFAMGILAGPVNRALPFAIQQTKRIFNKAEYDAAKKRMAENDEKMASKVNQTLADDPLNMFNSRLFNLGAQAKLADQIADPDTKAKQDAIEEATVKQISQMIEMNATDIWLDHLENIKKLTQDEYAEYFGISVEQADGHTQKIDQIITKTKDIVKNYEEVKEMYPNPVDLSAYKKGSIAYQKAALFSKAWDEAVKNVIFYNDSYKTTLSRMGKVYDAMTSNKLIGNIDPLRVQPLFNENDLDGEIGRLKTEIDALQGATTPESKKLLAERKESLVALEQYRESYNEFMNHFYKTARSQEDIEVEAIEKQIVNIDEKLKSKPSKVDKLKLEREKKRLNERLTQFEKNEVRTRERQELKNKRSRIEDINNEIDQLENTKNNLSTPEYYEQFLQGKVDSQYQEREIERIERKISNLEKEKELISTEVDSTMDATSEKMLANLEGSFKRYLNALARQSNEKTLDGKIDEAFELLVDYYRLGKEAQTMADAVNILNDPAGFAEHVDNNYTWMSDLWENREDMIRKNITEQTKRIQYNDLLNSLASKGIYVDLKEFANWKNNGELPTEFYDSVNKRVIPKGSILYDESIYEFLLLDHLLNQTEKLKSPEQKLKEKLKMLDALEQEEMDSLQQYNMRVDISNIDETEFTLNSVKDKIGIDQYLEATYTSADGLPISITFYKDADGNIKYNDNDGSVVGSISLKLREGKIFAYKQQPDPVEVKAIKDRYDQLRAEAAEGSIAETSSVILEGGEVSLDDLSVNTPIENMPAELREKLIEAFDIYRTDPNNEYLFPDNLTQADLDEKFAKYITTEPEAIDIVEKYIKEQRLKAATTQGQAAPPIFTLSNGKRVSAEDATDKQIQSVLLQYNNEINAIENNKNKSINDEIRLKELKEKYSILEAYFKSRAVKDFTPEMQNALELIKQLQKEQEKIESLPTAYKVGLKLLRRVTNVIQKFLGVKYEYSSKPEILAAFNVTVGEGQSVKDFIDVLKSSNLPGFNDKSYEAIEKFMNDYIANRRGTTAPVSDKKADIEKRNTFTRDSLKEISDGTGLAKKGTEILNPDKVASQLKIGDKIIFYAERERTGIWDGKTIREDKSNNPFGILGILSDVNGYIKNQSNIDAELAALEGAKEVTYYSLLEKAEKNVSATVGLNFAFFNALTNAIKNKEITSREQLNNILEDWNERSAYNGNPNRITSNQQKWINEELVKLPETTQAPEEDLEGLRDATVNFITEQATYQWGRDRGNVIDDLTKKYFSGVKIQPNLDEISQEAFDSLYGRNGIYKSIKNYIDKNDLIVVANGLIVYDEDANVAGEIDLLVVDRKGNFQIIDIKTGEAAKWAGYNNPQNKNYAKQIENTYQQMVYARLLKNMFGIDAKINILPIETTSDITTGKILTAKRPTVPDLLEAGKIVFPLKPTQEMYDKLNAEIPETKPKFNGTVPSNDVNDTINDPNLDDVEGTDYENENPEGEEGTEPNNLKEFNALKSKIEKADFDELQIIMVDLTLNSLKYTAEQLSELNSLIEARQEALKVQDENEEGEVISYNVGDEFYSESDIFTSTNRKFLSANETAVISERSGDRITIRPTKNKRKKPMEMSIEEFKKKFKPANTLFSGQGSPGPTVDESEGVTQESTDTVSDLLDGQDAASRQKDLEDQAKQEDTRDNLLDDLNCSTKRT